MRLIHAGMLPDGRIALLYECGEEWRYERIRLALFSLAWLAEGKDTTCR